MQPINLLVVVRVTLTDQIHWLTIVGRGQEPGLVLRTMGADEAIRVYFRQLSPHVFVEAVDQQRAGGIVEMQRRVATPVVKRHEASQVLHLKLHGGIADIAGGKHVDRARAPELVPFKRPRLLHLELLWIQRRANDPRNSEVVFGDGKVLRVEQKWESLGNRRQGVQRRYRFRLPYSCASCSPWFKCGSDQIRIFAFLPPACARKSHPGDGLQHSDGWLHAGARDPKGAVIGIGFGRLALD